MCGSIRVCLFTLTYSLFAVHSVEYIATNLHCTENLGRDADEMEWDEEEGGGGVVDVINIRIEPYLHQPSGIVEL